MSGFYSNRGGPIYFASALIEGGSPNHGIPLPVWDYSNGADYSGAVNANVVNAAFPRLADASSFAINLIPSNSVTITTSPRTTLGGTDRENIRLIAGCADSSNYVDAVIKKQAYTIWDGVPDTLPDMDTCKFPAGKTPISSGVGVLQGQYLLLEVGRVTDGTRVVLAESQIFPNDDSYLTAGLRCSLSLSILDDQYGDTVTILAMFVQDRLQRAGVAEQRACSHHWLSSSTSRQGIGCFCGVGKATNAGTYYRNVMFRNVHTPVIVPLSNAFTHNANQFGGVFQSKILLSDADAEYFGIINEDDDFRYPEDIAPSQAEFKSRSYVPFVGTATRTPTGADIGRNARIFNETAQGGMKAALTPGTRISQSILGPPSAETPSWSNVAQSQAYVDVLFSVANTGFGQWLPQSVRCYPQSNGTPYSATDCVFVGDFSGHGSSRPIDQAQYGVSEQTMTASGFVSVIASPSFGNLLYWDGTKWTQRYRYAAVFDVRVFYRYSQSTHQRINSSVTIGEQGAGVLSARMRWQAADGMNLDGLSGPNTYFAKALPESGLVPSGVAGSTTAIQSYPLKYVTGEWVLGLDTEQISPPTNCVTPAISLA